MEPDREQRAAVAAPLEPGLIIAGAGSGKTEVMAARVVHLVATGQVRPDEVLGLTFTTKATASLAARVRSGLERLRERVARFASTAGAARWTASRSCSTYNGYGARLVADHGLRIGIEPATRLAPEGLRWQLALAVVRRWDGPLDVEMQPAKVAERVRRARRRDGQPSGQPGGRDADRGRHGGDVVRRRQGRCGGQEGARAGRTRLQLLRLVEAFEQAKRDALLLDYGDQIALAARLARPAGRRRGRAHRATGSSCSTSTRTPGSRQRMLLQRLFGGGHPVTAVGDPAQSIYGFRGASVGNILRFPRAFPRRGAAEPARVYPLTRQLPQRRGDPATSPTAVVSGLAQRPAPGSAHPCSRPGPAARRRRRRRGRSGCGCLPTPKPKRGGSPTRRAAASERREEHSDAVRAPECTGLARGGGAVPPALPVRPAAPGARAAPEFRSRWSGSAACSMHPKSLTSSRCCGCCTTRRPTRTWSGCSPAPAGVSGCATSMPWAGGPPCWCVTAPRAGGRRGLLPRCRSAATKPRSERSPTCWSGSTTCACAGAAPLSAAAERAAAAAARRARVVASPRSISHCPT